MNHVTSGRPAVGDQLRLDRLTVDHPPKGWPTHPRQVTQRLRRQAPLSMQPSGRRVIRRPAAASESNYRPDLHAENRP